MNEIELRRAGAQDVPLLTDLRKTVLIAANKLPADADLSHLDGPCAAYFADEGKHTTILALDGDKIVGERSADYHTEMPTCANPSGRCAFLMNIYTDPAYRRKGIAARIVGALVEDARARGAGSVLLEATDMGAPLYRKLGFVDAKGYMRLNL